MAVWLGAQVRSVTIVPDRDDGPQRHGESEVAWETGSLGGGQEELVNAARLAMSGPVAEMIYRGEPLHPGFVSEWAADWQTAWRVTEWIVDERKRLAFLEKTTADLYKLFDGERQWAAIAAVADNLLAHDRLEGHEVEEIVASWLG